MKFKEIRKFFEFEILDAQIRRAWMLIRMFEKVGECLNWNLNIWKFKFSRNSEIVQSGRRVSFGKSLASGKKIVKNNQRSKLDKGAIQLKKQKMKSFLF